MSDQSRIAKSNSATMEDGPLVSAAKRAEDAARSLREVSGKRLAEAMDTSREYIRDDPLKSVLIAAGVGAVVGYLIGRRR